MAALQSIRLPELDPPKLERPNLSLPDGMPKFDLPSIDLSNIGRRKSRRSAWPFALFGLMIAGAAWIVMTNESLRMRLRELGGAARDGIASWQRSAFGQGTSDEPEPVAFTAAETRPIPADRWSESDDKTPDYPEGLGSDTAPSSEESALGV